MSHKKQSSEMLMSAAMVFGLGCLIPVIRGVPNLLIAGPVVSVPQLPTDHMACSQKGRDHPHRWKSGGIKGLAETDVAR